MSARPRRGAALAIALFALLTVAALAHAVLAPAAASRRASRRTTAYHVAESVAEGAIAGIAGVWTIDRWKALEPGEVVAETKQVSKGDPPLRVFVESRVLRLDARVFAVSTLATAAQPDAPVAARRSLLVELRAEAPAAAPALTSGGNVSLASDTEVTGADTCPGEGPGPERPLVVSPTSRVTVNGTPADEGTFTRDPFADSATTHARPAGVDIARLRDIAASALPAGSIVSPAPAAMDGVCAPAASNWGGGGGECAAYRPVIVAEGDLEVRRGEGQGILIVEGTLMIRGPFAFSGLIVATGGLETADGPVTLNGAVFTGRDGVVTFGEGPTVIRASRCALAAALDSSPLLRVVPLRGWWR